MSNRIQVLAAIGTAVVIVAAVVLLAAAPSGSNHKSGVVASLGTSQKYGHLTVTALAVGENLGGAEQAPTPGNKWVFVLVSARNDGASPYDVEPAEKAWLTDSQGGHYAALESLGDNGSFEEGALEGEIPPTEAVRGEIGFEVPMTASDLVFSFGNNDASWALPDPSVR